MTVPRLTPEQIRIIALVAEGWTDKAIAQELDVSVSTVKRRLLAAGRELGTRTRVRISMRATALGLISAQNSHQIRESDTDAPSD